MANTGADFQPAAKIRYKVEKVDRLYVCHAQDDHEDAERCKVQTAAQDTENRRNRKERDQYLDNEQGAH